MNFPNALKGLKKIHRSQLLALITEVLMFVSAVLMITAQVDETAADKSIGTEAVAAFVLIIIAGILTIIAFIMNLSGIISARKDEPLFGRALIFTLTGIVSSTLSSILASNTTVSGILSVISDIAMLFVMIYVIEGIPALAKKLENDAMAEKGSRLITLILVGQILAIAAKAVSTIFEGNRTAVITAAAIGLVSAAIDIAVLFIYFRYLGRSVKMLKEA